MPMRVIPDQNQPSAAIEIPLEKPLPDYDLEELEKATPRDVDGILVTQGFRDLVDDARGILTELIAAPPAERRGSGKEIGRASCRERGGVWEAGGGWRYEGGRCGA